MIDKQKYVLLGKHLFSNIPNFPKKDIVFCLEKMLEAVPIMGMKAIQFSYLRDPDQAFVILSTSHMALHIVQRNNVRFGFVDIFTCGPGDPKKGYLYLRKEIGFSQDNYEVRGRYRLTGTKIKILKS
ncbi:S-adenosylmethionine decarboxylase [Candidatus Pacearchaeota archaeon]|nr:S-adenosylmethionine decarboxylase [Candidatus Pacearchaeota archaeon]